MNILVLAVRYAHDLEFFRAFTDQEDADNLKKQILADHPRDLVEGDVVVTSIQLTIRGNQQIFLEGVNGHN
jgi:hypothetical protein